MEGLADPGHMLEEGDGVLLGGVAGLVIEHLDRVVTGKLVTLAAVTMLTLTGRLYVLAGSVLQQATNTARPMLGQMLGQGRSADAVRVYHQLFAVSTGTAVVVGTAITDPEELTRRLASAPPLGADG